MYCAELLYISNLLSDFIATLSEVNMASLLLTRPGFSGLSASALLPRCIQSKHSRLLPPFIQLLHHARRTQDIWPEDSRKWGSSADNFRFK
jgi:hypothetical protein